MQHPYSIERSVEMVKAIRDHFLWGYQSIPSYSLKKYMGRMKYG
jgi:hypothetical protein